MCLNIDKNEIVKTATEDIICYKVIHVHDNHDGDVIKYETPYRYNIIELGKTYHSDLILEDEIIEIGLHSFTTYYHAHHEYHWMCKYANAYTSLKVKCIIPKGSKYCIGNYDGAIGNSIASDTITYIEIIE